MASCKEKQRIYPFSGYHFQTLEKWKLRYGFMTVRAIRARLSLSRIGYHPPRMMALVRSDVVRN